MPFAVRPASPADARAMGKIHVAAWRAAYAGVMDGAFLAGMDPEQGEAWWREMLDGQPSDPEPWAHFVTELEGRVVAMATVGPAREREPGLPAAELWMLNTHPDAFGSGAATALHDAALATLAARRIAGAYLWVARDNPRARRFYEREGWSRDGGEKTAPLGGVDVSELRYVRTV